VTTDDGGEVTTNDHSDGDCDEHIVFIVTPSAYHKVFSGLAGILLSIA